MGHDLSTDDGLRSFIAAITDRAIRDHHGHRIAPSSRALVAEYAVNGRRGHGGMAGTIYRTIRHSLEQGDQ